MKQECGVFIVTIKKHVTPLYSCLKVLWYELIAFVLCECFVKVTVRCLRGGTEQHTRCRSGGCVGQYMSRRPMFPRRAEEP